MSGSRPLLPLYVFMIRTGITLPVTFSTVSLFCVEVSASPLSLLSLSFRVSGVMLGLEIYLRTIASEGPGVAWWLRHCATSRTVPGSISGGVTGFFIDIFLPNVPWPWARLSP
jgi:hypothetical protein